MSSVSLEHTDSILLIKTDENFARSATIDLKHAGYKTFFVNDLNNAVGQIKSLQPAMLLIDYISTEDWGLKLCRQLRNSGSVTPIVIVLDQANVNERVATLESGADDYLLKPYYSQNLLKLVSLYLNPPEKNTEQLRFGELVLDLTTRRLYRSGEPIELTMKEFELLKYMMSHPLETLTREQILENVWGYDFRGESNVIEVYVRYLRLKIEPTGQKRLIQTVRGVGYVLKE